MTLVTSLFNASLLYCSKSHGWAGLIYLYKNIKDLALGQEVRHSLWLRKSTVQ